MSLANQKYHSREEYQSECVKRIGELSDLGTERILIVLPTSAGKTHIFTRFCESYSHKTFLIIVPRINLVTQTKVRFEEIVGESIGIWCASLGRKEIKRITVASIQSIDIDKLPEFDYLIHDECHGHTEILEALESKVKYSWIGFTATPFKGSEKIYGEGKFYDEIHFTIKISDLIKSGFITSYRLKAPPSQFNLDQVKVRAGDFASEDLKKLVDDVEWVKIQVVDMIERISDRNKIIICCIDIEHCKLVTKILQEYKQISVMTHSKMPRNDCLAALDKFENGDAKFLVSVNQVSEGYDAPVIDTVVLMRPTKSARLMIQTIGRGLRLYKGKEYCQVLDYGRVIENCGTPENPILEDGDESTTKVCDNCSSVNRIDAIQCYQCAKFFEIKESVLDIGQMERDVKSLSSRMTELPYGYSENDEWIVSVFIDRKNVTKAGKNVPKIILNTNKGSHLIWVPVVRLNKLFGENANGFVKINNKPKIKVSRVNGFKQFAFI